MKDLNILGTFNSISEDKTIARAEQISINKYNGTSVKLPEEFLTHVKGIRSAEIKEFIEYLKINNISYGDTLFICVDNSSEYKQGHMYFYDSAKKELVDITLMNQTTSNRVERVELNIDFDKTEIQENTIQYFPYDFSSTNPGIGFIYVLVDGVLHEKLKVFPGKGEIELNLSGWKKGQHEINIYAVDYDDVYSEYWRHNITIVENNIDEVFDYPLPETKDEDILIEDEIEILK